MATSIRAHRLKPASSLAALQADLELYEVAEELHHLLTTKPLPLVTGADALQALQVRHPLAAMQQNPPWYEWVWDPVRQAYVCRCHSTSVISVPTSTMEILVTVENTAQYS